MNLLSRGHREQPFLRLFVFISFLSIGEVAVAQPEPVSGSGEKSLAEDTERAIERGCEFLRRSLAKGPIGSASSPYHLGWRALYSYALLESGTDPYDPMIQRLFEEMGKLEFQHVYGVSLYVMALHAWKSQYLEQSDDQTSDKGVTKASDSRIPLPNGRLVKDELKRGVAWLLHARCSRTGLWGYGPLTSAGDDWVDFSNTQFAVLALHVGRLEGLEIPTRVYERLIERLAESSYQGTNALSVSVDRAPWIDQKDSDLPRGPAEDSQLRGPPISWGYRPTTSRSRRIPGSAGWGTVSMTSAAVSSLLVAQYGLEVSGRSTRRHQRVLEVLVNGGAIELSRSWGPRREEGRGSTHRNLFYTMYSFEKAMDLAGVTTLDGVDWYRSQVPLFLLDQNDDGSWGWTGGEYRKAATCFALLFLRRATASLTVHPPDPIVTHGALPRDQLEDGRVFVPSLGGVVSLGDLISQLRKSPSRDLIQLLTEMIESVSPVERPKLFSWLYPLLGDEIDSSVVSFVREELSKITGLPARASDQQLERWFACWKQLRGMDAESREESIDELCAFVLDETLGVPLRSEGVTVLRRIRSLQAIPALLTLLADDSSKLRREAHLALIDLTRTSKPFTPDGSPEIRSQEVAVWMAWWELHRETLQSRRRFENLRVKLERSESPEERSSLRKLLVEMGLEIVPYIDRVIAEESFAFDWILIRGELTGEVGVPLRK